MSGKNVFVVVIAGLALGCGLSWAALIQPELVSILDNAGPDEKIPVEFFMKEQANALDLDPGLVDMPKPLRRARVAAVLQEFSARTQRGILEALSAKSASGRVEDVRSLWLCNLVSCWATKEVIYELAARPDVELVLYAKVPVELAEMKSLNVPAAVADAIEPNMVVTNVRGAWAQGYHGEGVVIGVVDTGVRYTHDDLKGHLWTSSVYPNCGFNFASNQYSSGHPGPSPYDTLTPLDYYGHGTHCAGIATADGTYGNGTRDTMGIAPAARIMSVPVDVYLHTPYPDTSMENNTMAGFQFCVSPPRDPTNGADVITTSLGLISNWLPRRAVWRACEVNILAAGIVHCVAAGNESSQRTIRTPGDCPPPWPNPANHPTDKALSAVITVGATDNSDNAASFTSKGPSDWGSVPPYNDYAYPPGLTDPDVCMPGVDILSTYYSGDQSYTRMSGTSMATPGAAGVVCLMLSKNPTLSPREIDSILELHSVKDLGTPGKDNTFGAGRLNCSLAVAHTPFPGPRHDVGMGQVLAPGAKIDPLVPLAPVVTVVNRGTYPEANVVVHCWVDSAGTRVYNQTRTITLLDSAGTDTVTFPNWNVGPGSQTYEVTFWHYHVPDTNRGNDTIRKTTTTRGHDVQTAGMNVGNRVRANQPFAPSVTLKNIGDYTETGFVAYCRVDSSGQPVYSQSAAVDSVPLGGTKTVTFPNWNVGPDSVFYTVRMWHNCGPDQNRLNDTLSKTTMSSASVMRVAIELPSGSVGRNPPNACYALDSLCGVWGWEDSIVAGTDIDEQSELAEYTVVVSGASGSYGDYDHAVYDDALLQWLRGGGGFVGTGWLVYAVYRGAGAGSPMDSAMAVRCTGDYGFLTSGQVRILDTLHPITQGVADFSVYGHGEYANTGLWPDAFSLGDYTSAAGKWSIAYKTVGAGRSVYLGPIYMANFGGYENEPYFTNPNSVRLLKQAIEWAAWGGTVGTSEPGPVQAQARLLNVCPNPATARVTISYSLPGTTPVRLTLYDLAGREVRTLVHSKEPAGLWHATWDRTSDAGVRVPAGVYFVRFEAGGTVQDQKLVVQR